ncbi:MAG: ATP synthase F0 subunit B [Oligoflexia bacterium]|nr:ATP synthase F0 subunit B [Oligoflexia bacterium]
MISALIKLVLLAVTVSFAAETGHHEVDLGHALKTVGFQALNFFGLVAILAYFLGPKIKEYFKSRNQSFSKALEEAQRVRIEAEQKHAEYSVKLQKLEQESKSMLEQVSKEGAERKQRIIEEARRLAANIEIEAKRAAQNEIERAKAEIYNELLDESLSGARALLDKTVAENDQRRLQKEFVTKIGASQ